MKNYIYFQDFKKFLGLPFKVFTLSDSTEIGVHRLLGDDNLNLKKPVKDEEIEAEKNRLIALGIPEKDFQSYDEIMADLENYEKNISLLQ